MIKTIDLWIAEEGNPILVYNSLPFPVPRSRNEGIVGV